MRRQIWMRSSGAMSSLTPPPPWLVRIPPQHHTYISASNLSQALLLCHSRLQIPKWDQLRSRRYSLSYIFPTPRITSRTRPSLKLFPASGLICGMSTTGWRTSLLKPSESAWKFLARSTLCRGWVGTRRKWRKKQKSQLWNHRNYDHFQPAISHYVRVGTKPCIVSHRIQESNRKCIIILLHDSLFLLLSRWRRRDVLEFVGSFRRCAIANLLPR